MPVKNKSRLTNSGFKGVITSLNKEEKEVLANEGIASSDKVPTNVVIKDNKIGLGRDSVWLTNQNAITLGSNLEYDATTKTLNAKMGGGGSESVSPTLNLMDLGEGTVRTTITEQEKLNLEKGLYNQVNYFRSNQGLDGLSVYMPSKLFSIYGSYLFCVMIAVDENNPVVNNLDFYRLQVGEKNADGEYPITIHSGMDGGISNIPFGTSGGSSDTAIITLTAEQVQSLSQFEITFTQEQATLLEKATSFKFYYAGNEIAHGQCGKIIQGSTTAYGLSMIIGNNIFSGLGSGSSGLGRILDYKEKIILASAFPYGAVSNVRTDIRGNVLYIDRYANNNVFLDSTSTPKTTSIYFDKINGKSIIHEDGTINNYDLGKSINLFGNHSILVPSTSTDTAINLYNHFITLSGSEISCSFTITNSRPEPYTKVGDIYTYLSTAGSSISISATGSYNGASGKGIVSQIYFSSPLGQSLVTFTNLEIEVVENVPTIKMTEKVATVFLNSVYSDKVIEL